MSWVTSESVGPVRVLRLDRPPANAMNVALLEELGSALEAVAEDPPAALVLSGREGFFSAGADLKEIPGYSAAEHQAMARGINRMVLSAYALPCPTVAAITGHAIAGGMVLALCFDVRIASAEGRYGLTEIKVGVPYPQAAIGVVGAELAPHAARRLALGSQLTDSAQCQALGVFDEVVSPDEVVERAVTVAQELSALPGGVYARTKRDLRGAPLEAMRAGAEAEPLLG